MAGFSLRWQNPHIFPTISKSMVNLTNKIISWSFYLLFFLVPLWFFSGSHELFEYNKIMLTYGLTIVIAAAWLVKLVVSHQSSAISIKRTPLDIPIALYLLSHIISTIFSLDPHTSIWGYYSRFHEGLLATISYIVLYYAAVSNLQRPHILRILQISFVSAAIVAIYGTFEHFGHSPSCLFITGNFDVDCWVQDVKNRVFATLGQPNWMAAYLDVVLLSVFGFLFSGRSQSVFSLSDSGKPKTEKLNSDNRQQRTDNQGFIIYTCLSVLLFAALLFTKSRSGILGLFTGLAIFGFFQLKSLKNFWKVAAAFLITSAIFGLPFSQIEKFSLENFLTNKPSTVNPGLGPQAEPRTASTQKGAYIDIGISESGDIRRIVWQGAIKVWQRYPIFGSGVETFAYAYYQDRPVEHNMVSEWDFLYNKAHNEFLNILATTGTVGMLAYLSILGMFTLLFLKSKKEPLTIALFAAWSSILITNFFGFSVVIIGLYFFLIPAFYEILSY